MSTDTIRVDQVGSRYVASASYEQRALPKTAGFRWDPTNKVWYTTDPAVAARLNDPNASAKLQAEIATRDAAKSASISASRAASADIELPCPEGLAYLPYQRAGIAEILRRFGFDFSLLPNDNGSGEENAERCLSANVESTTGVGCESRQGKAEECQTEGGTGPATDSQRSSMEEESVRANQASDAPHRREDEASSSVEKSRAAFCWGERTATDADSELCGIHSGAAGICSRIAYQDEGARDGTQLPAQLQSGFRGAGQQDGDRIGRSIAQASGEARTGSQEGCSTQCPRLASDSRQSLAGVLLADSMGLGKTIQAIGVINCDSSIKKILVVCPATLKLNWRNELNRWLTKKRSILIAESSSCPCEAFEITIINYDILSRNRDKIDRVAWDLAIIDEAHYIKAGDSKRAIAVAGQEKKGQPLKTGISARFRLMLTGTPIPSRPIEGWPIFHYLAPEEFRSFWGYAKRFCAAEQNRYGWDLTGASNLAELQDRLRASIMLRRLKEEVLTELPAKRRAVIELAQNGASSAVKAEQQGWAAYQEMIEDLRLRVELAKASDKPEDYEDAVSKLKAAARAAFTEMAKLRHATAVAKIPYLIQHINDSIEGGKKVIVFVHHKDVVAALEAEFGSRSVSITGDTPMNSRQSNVERFQSDPECLVFIGNIQAAGVGITLTASSHVIFGELDWVPGNVTQCEDRAHRIGPKEMVLVQHLVLEGSLDAKMARTIVEKQNVIDQALDKEHVEIPETPRESREKAATESTSRDKIGEEAAKMTPERITAVHQGLKMLAGMDADFAREVNNAGFSKIDVQIGHSLAERWELTPRQAALGSKLVNKYRRQLPTELVAAAKGGVA